MHRAIPCELRRWRKAPLARETRHAWRAFRNDLHREAYDAVIDLQIGNMGGMATVLGLRLEEGAGRLPHIPVAMLLDRQADIFLARRSEADGWLVKPLDSLRLRKAASALLGGGGYREGELGQYTAPPPEPSPIA